MGVCARQGHSDLYVVNIIAIPDRLKDAIAETKGQNILHRFFAEIMIYAVNLAFREDRAELVIDNPGRGAVLAQRLLDDDARLRRDEAVAGKPRRDGAEQVRAGRKVIGADAVRFANRRLEITPACLASGVYSDVAGHGEEGFDLIRSRCVRTAELL